MRTFSHALITAAAAKPLKLNRANYIAVLVGSALPDIPLYFLTGITMLTSPSWDIGMARMHSNYETNLLWISSHNFFHSLPILGLLSLMALPLPKNGETLFFGFLWVPYCTQLLTFLRMLAMDLYFFFL